MVHLDILQIMFSVTTTPQLFLQRAYVAKIVASLLADFAGRPADAVPGRLHKMWKSPT